jgi:hypothetical protein
VLLWAQAAIFHTRLTAILPLYFNQSLNKRQQIGILGNIAVCFAYCAKIALMLPIKTQCAWKCIKAANILYIKGFL